MSDGEKMMSRDPPWLTEVLLTVERGERVEPVDVARLAAHAEELRIALNDCAWSPNRCRDDLYRENARTILRRQEPPEVQ